MTFSCQTNVESAVHLCGYNVTTGKGILNPLTVIQGGSEITSSSTVTEGFIHAFGIEVWSVPQSTTTTTEEATSVCWTPGPHFHVQQSY